MRHPSPCAPWAPRIAPEVPRSAPWMCCGACELSPFVPWLARKGWMLAARGCVGAEGVVSCARCLAFPEAAACHARARAASLCPSAALGTRERSQLLSLEDAVACASCHVLPMGALCGARGVGFCPLGRVEGVDAGDSRTPWGGRCRVVRKVRELSRSAHGSAVWRARGQLLSLGARGRGGCWRLADASGRKVSCRAHGVRFGPTGCQ